jgi:hypothetical protein
MTKHTENLDHDARIAELEREVVALKAAVFPKPVPVARPYIERGVSITHLASPPSNLPTAEEFDQLLAMVRDRYPICKRPESASDASEARYRRAFANGFRFVIQAFKRAEPNSSVSGDWWVGEAQEFLRSIGAPAEVSWSALCAAIIATGDIPYTDPSLFPYINVGLSRGSREHPYKPIYKEILAGTRSFLPPIEKKTAHAARRLYW